MAWGFLGRAVSNVRDVFDANSQEDQRKRLARGEARFYDDQQRAQGNRAPASNPVEQARNIAVDVGRGVARIPETVVRSTIAQPAANIYTQLTGKPDIDVSSGEVTDPIRRAIYGSEPVKTYQQRTAENIKKLETGESVLNVFGEKGKEAGKKNPVGFGFLAAGLTLGGDLTGGGKKQAGEKIVKNLADNATPQEVKKTLKNKVPDSVIQDVAGPTSITKDPNVIKNILQKSTNETINPESGESILGGLAARGAQLVPTEPPPSVSQDIVSATVPRVSGEVIPPQSADPFQDISNAITGSPGQRGIRSAVKEQQQLLSKERGQRFSKSAGAGADESGSAGYFKERAALKGQYSKVSYGGMIDDIGPGRAEDLFSQARDQVRAVPDSVYDELGLHPKAARFNTQTALRKVIFGEGGLPTKSELKLIEAVSPQLAADVASKIPKEHSLMETASKLFGLPRGLLSSLDLSMGGRQGLVVAARHPVIWGRANKESVKYLKSEKYFNDEMARLRKTPEYEVGEKYGLATPAANQAHEEIYAASDLAAKFPGVKRSARAYEGGLTKLRSDMWANSLRKFGGPEEAERLLGEKGMRGLAEAINTLTGRGGKKGGFIDKHANSLGETLFSPRLWASRLQPLNPTYWHRIGPAGRKEALSSMSSFAALAGIVLGAAVAAGAEVETDPRSSDFLKIKVGDTRYDILGGFQQNLVFAARQITGEKKNSQSGNVTKFAKSFPDLITGKSNEEAGVSTSPYAGNRLTSAASLVGNKLNPVLGTGLRLYSGEDRGGQELDTKGTAAEILNLFVPLNLQATYDTAKNEGFTPGGVATAVGKNIPGVFGIGSQTYGIKDTNLAKTPTEYIDKLKSGGAPAEQVEATTRFYQYQKNAPARDDAATKIKNALGQNDIETAVSIAKDYNQKYLDSFSEWKKKYGKYAQDKQIQKDYQSKLFDDSDIDRYINDIKKERGQ